MGVLFVFSKMLNAISFVEVFVTFVLLLLFFKLKATWRTLLLKGKVGHLKPCELLEHWLS